MGMTSWPGLAWPGHLGWPRHPRHPVHANQRRSSCPLRVRGPAHLRNPTNFGLPGLDWGETCIWSWLYNAIAAPPVPMVMTDPPVAVFLCVLFLIDLFSSPISSAAPKPYTP
ncbi:hypothetical protein LZ31DRAFT_579392, partial [Colletotrichum somersetense]